MRVFVSVKQAGKRKECITKKELVLEETPPNLIALIEIIIRINVKEYNDKSIEPSIIKYLLNDEIEAKANTGKVGFGALQVHQEVDADKAVDTALLAFEDGLFRVFIGDIEIQSLNEDISIKENDVLTFIRFTMLAGRVW